MKNIKKFLKEFCFLTNVRFYHDGKVLWEGSILDVPKKFYKKYEIDNEGLKTGDWEPVSISHHKNDCGVVIYWLDIEVKRKEDK